MAELPNSGTRRQFSTGAASGYSSIARPIVCVYLSGKTEYEQIHRPAEVEK